MNIEAGTQRFFRIIDFINEKKVVIPDYQRQFCWDKSKIDLLIDSVLNDIPIGVFQFRLVGNTLQVVDGLHRIRLLVSIIYGKGFYFDFENRTFTQDSKHFNYSAAVDVNGTIWFSRLHNITTEEEYFIFQNAYNKFSRLDILQFQYVGTDEEIEKAFSRINTEGVAFTPTFTKVGKTQIFEV